MALPRPFYSYLKRKTEEEEEADRKAYEEYRDIISTWQQEKPPTFSCSIQKWSRHRDSWYVAAVVMPNVVAAEKNFKSRPTDVLLATSLKTGTTWAKALLLSTIHCRGSEDHRQEFAQLMATANPHEWVPVIETEIYNAGQLPDLEPIPSPRLFHTHIPRCSLPASVEESRCRVVYVWRDPKDVVVSWWHWVNNIRRVAGKDDMMIDVVVEDFIQGVHAYGNYWDHVMGYWNYNLENPGSVLFLRYEDMMADPTGNLKKLADFVGKPFSAEEEKEGVILDIVRLCSFDSLKGMPINQKGNYTGWFERSFIENASFFRQGKVGGWALHLSLEMAERIDEITQTKFGPSGLLSPKFNDEERRLHVPTTSSVVLNENLPSAPLTIIPQSR